MESFQKWLTFNKGERVAIITLLVAILVLIMLCLFHSPRQSLDEASLHNLDSLLALHQSAIEERASQPKESVESQLFPIKANTAFERPKKSERVGERAKKAIPVVDLNTVDSTTLVELPQIGPYSAMRIIEYRERLGGFVDIEQLREVKGMDSARFAIATPYINIGEAQPRSLDVNRADFKTLLRHPYLSYEQVKRIFNHLEKKGMIKNWNQLENLLKEEGEVNPLLEPYLRY
jgi:DNA uptake protein ComE-like DNA-binding protein